MRVTACGCLCAVFVSALKKPFKACPPGSASGSGGSAASIAGSATSPAAGGSARAPCAAFSAAESGCESSARVSVALVILASPTAGTSSKRARAGVSLRAIGCKMRNALKNGTCSTTSPRQSTVTAAMQARDVNGARRRSEPERRSGSVAAGHIAELFTDRAQHFQVAIRGLTAADLLLERGLGRQQLTAIGVRCTARRGIFVERVFSHERWAASFGVVRARLFRGGRRGARRCLFWRARQIAHVDRLRIECGQVIGCPLATHRIDAGRAGDLVQERALLRGI